MNSCGWLVNWILSHLPLGIQPILLKLFVLLPVPEVDEATPETKKQQADEYDAHHYGDDDYKRVDGLWTALFL